MICLERRLEDFVKPVGITVNLILALILLPLADDSLSERHHRTGIGRSLVDRVHILNIVAHNIDRHRHLRPTRLSVICDL